MKRIFKIAMLCCLVLLAGVSSSQAQQLPQYSQYIFNGLSINPAYAGYKGVPYIQSTYRSQWSNYPGAPKTFSISADLSANEGRMGFGASIVSDQLGPSNSLSALVSYAYRIQTGDYSFFSMGISAGVSEYAIDGSQLRPDENGDPDIPEGKVNTFTPDMNVGLFFNNRKFFAGLSVFNLVGQKSLERKDISLAYHDLHYYFTAGTIMPISANVKFKPSVLIKDSKGSPTNFDLNGMFLFFESFWAGASYRSNLGNGNEALPESLSKRNSVAAILEIFATKHLRIGYAYDHNTNILSNLRNNSHEISVGYYILPTNNRIKNQRWF
ncbi:membrane protein [Echinicola pacifica]|uniref:Membrane protein n=1 Tax=Echinicola pacifica TaxID=346377 RepID=A0A918UL17_9BACT|nr:type IX secretion system membrane protein PorP/SprF [Echinicola pacifica]GGZ18237.1 membrane protein [Echinicola pacifica]